MHREFFVRTGLLALVPSAFGMAVDVPAVATSVNAPARVVNGVAVVDVVGPLEHHVGHCFDSYDAIKARVGACLERAAVKSVMFAIDSPGGMVAGVFDTAREIRAMCDAAGKDLFAFVDALAASAGYVLACVATRIYLPASGVAGSIGVLSALCSQVRADRAMGIDYSVIGSGARKADGNPHVEITPDAEAIRQAEVDSAARIFFELVGEYRGHVGLTAQKAQALDAAMLTGQDAISAGLADEIATFDQALAMVASGATKENTMSAYDDAIAALRKEADGGGPKAARAKRMLRAELEDDDDDTVDDVDTVVDDDKKKEDDAIAASAATDDAPPPKDEKKDDVDAKAVATQALTAVHTLKAQMVADAENHERKALLATRPDLDPVLVKLLSSAPLAQVRETVASLPRIGNVVETAAAAITATHAPVSAQSYAGLAGKEADEMAVQMGLKASGPTTVGIQTAGEYAGQWVHPMLTPTQIRAAQAAKAKVSP